MVAAGGLELLSGSFLEREERPFPLERVSESATVFGEELRHRFIDFLANSLRA